MMIAPAGNKIVVRPEGRSGCGVVVAVGPECAARAEYADGSRFVAVGDRILFGKWCGCEVSINGYRLVVLQPEDIYGVVAIEDVVGEGDE